MTEDQKATLTRLAMILEAGQAANGIDHARQEIYAKALRALLSASIADTAGAKPVARVVYSLDVDGDCYARAAWLDETVIEDGALLYLAAAPAPSVADAAGASEFREVGMWEPDGSKFKTYAAENLNGKAMFVKEPK